MKTAIVVVMLALAGCASTTYAHRTRDAEDFRIDKAQCHAQAFQGYGSQSNVFVAVSVMKSCLEGKGWYPVDAPAPTEADQASTPGLRR